MEKLNQNIKTKHKIKRIIRRIFGLSLVISMLFTMQGITSFAQTNNNNENALNETIQNAGVGTPSNPVHICTKADDGTDTTTWSYIYFGSYPQSEVTDATIITAIDSEISTGNGTAADAGFDVWVDGTKYRRISKSDTNYDGNFGESIYRYFKWERIKWRVLQNDGDTLYVMADTALDCKAYNEEDVSVTWETSTIRNWLNSNFYQTAFSSEEQNAIVTQNVVNEDNPDYATEGGNDTTDNVYLLSSREVANETYGFCSDVGVYSASRRLQASMYAIARGAYVTNTEYGNNCWWWLRWPGDYSSFFSVGVDNNGYVCANGFVTGYRDGIVPALHINLSSDLWFMTDDGNSGEVYEKTETPEATLASESIIAPNTKVSLTCENVGADIYYTTDGTEPTTGSNLYTEAISIDKDMTIKAIAVCEGYAASDVAEFSYKVQEGNNNDNANTPSNPVHTCTKLNDGTDTTTWSYVYFGSYPQSEVTDTTIIAAIDSAISAGNGTNADTGIDVWVDGTKYRRISKNDTSYDGYFGESTYRYFKWERIRWRVLQNDGNTLYVMADTALDCKAYNDEYEDTTWETSTLRSWLNNNFYQTAFSVEEQNAIVTQNVINEDNPDYGTEGGNDTTDNVYLLSIEEVTNEMYGFCSDAMVYSASRWLQASTYANARGVYASNKNNCWWWLRSPGNGSNDAAYVYSDGDVSRYGSDVNNNNDGIAPALHINLSSDLWSMTDDGGSGEVYEKTAQPEATLASGSIVAPNTIVSLTCETVNANIYYTTDGTEPTIGSNLYTEAISIDQDMTIKAIAVCEGYATSDVAEFSYKVQKSNNNNNTSTPSNPIHTCTKENYCKNTTTWSYIYFGNYPQSEVTDSTVIDAIDSEILAENAAFEDTSIDVWVDGTKYRRIGKGDTNYDGYFGENAYRYFKWERIKWRVQYM